MRVVDPVDVGEEDRLQGAAGGSSDTRRHHPVRQEGVDLGDHCFDVAQIGATEVPSSTTRRTPEIPEANARAWSM